MAMAIIALRRPGPRPGHDGDGEQDEGKGHQDIGEPHDEGLDPAAIVAGEEPEAHAHEHGRRGGAHAGEQRDPCAPDEAAQEVAAELVGAEGMPGRARCPSRSVCPPRRGRREAATARRSGRQLRRGDDDKARRRRSRFRRTAWPISDLIYGRRERRPS